MAAIGPLAVSDQDEEFTLFYVGETNFHSLEYESD